MRISRWRWIGAVALLAVLLPAAPATGGEEPMETVLAVLPGGEELLVELAVTTAQRRQGLMFRDELPGGQGMLLIFPDSGFRAIWMKNVRIPLDLVWLDRTHRVVHLERNVPPCSAEPCPDYHSMRKASAVLELNAGSAETLGIEPGQQLEFIPPIR